MATPSLPSVNSFDVMQGTTITYQANNGYTQISKSVVYVLDSTGSTIGTHTYIGTSSAEMETTHVLSPVTVGGTNTGWDFTTYGHTAADFVNNTQYQMYIIWYDTSNVAQSESNRIGFWTLPQPSVSLQTPASPYTISVTTYTVSAIYNTQNSIINNAPSETQFDLYRLTNDELVAQSPVLYTSGTIGSDGTYQLDYTFSGLENGTTYYIVIQTTSTQGMLTSDGTNKDKRIKPSISIKELNVLSAEANNCDGCIDITGTINNIVGVYDNDSTATPTITTSGIDLRDTGSGSTKTSHNMTFDDGLKFSNNWNLSFWCNQFDYADNTTVGSTQYILHLSNYETLEDAVIDVFMVEVGTTQQKAVMIVYPLGYDGGISSYFESNVIAQPDYATNQFTCVRVQYKDYYYYINLENVTVQPRQDS